MQQPAEADWPAVTVVYDADIKSIPYQPNEAVRALVQKAKQAFGVVSNHVLALFASGGGELRENESVAAAGIQPGARLVLGQSVLKGG